MKNNRVVETIIFVVCAVFLLTAAKYSEKFVPSSFQKEAFEPSTIEPRDNMYGVTQVNDRLIWLAGNNGKIVRSKDGGKTWVSLDSSTVKHLQDISAWDEKHLVAVGNEGAVIITENGGNTWKEIQVPKSEIANKLIRVKTFPGGSAWACGVVGAAFFSQDYGRTWQRRIPEEDIAYNDIAFASENVGVIVCEFGRIKRTEDGGDTWEEIETDLKSSLMSVAFNDKGVGIAVGLSGAILRSIDAGKTWHIIQNTASKEHLFNITYHNDKWIGIGNRGIIAISSDNGKNWQIGTLSKHELLWHVGLAQMSSKLIIDGGTQGFYENGKWSYLF